MTSHPARGPVDATVTPGTAAPPRSPGCPASTRWSAPTWPSSASRSTPACQLPARAPGSAPATSASLVRLLRHLQPGAGRRAVRRPAGRRRRRHRLQPVRHQRGGPADRRGRAAPCSSAGARLMTIGGDHTIALPLLRAMHAGARPGRGGALRRAPGHLGHLLRRAVHPRHAVPPGLRGGPARPDRCMHVGIRGPLYSTEDLDRRPRSSASRSSAHRRHGRPRARGRRRADPGARGRPAGLRVGRHRRAGPGVRAGHRHAGGRRADQPRAAGDPARASPTSTSSVPTSSRSPPPTTTPRSPASPPRTWPTS